jgi:heat shock protein HslJ
MTKKLMKIITILLISLSITDCESQKKATKNNTKKERTSKANSSNEKLNRVWMMVEFKGFEKQFLVDSKAELNLTNPNLAMAKMGCNTLSFAYKIANSGIVFSKGITTLMACTEMKLEDTFAKEIQDFRSFKIEGQTLTLYNSKKEKMIFVAQDWD